MPSSVEIDIIPDTKKLEALTTAIIDLLDELKLDFERFQTTLESLGE